LVHLGTNPEPDGGVVIRWNELGAAFTTTGATDGNVRIVNINSSQTLHVIYKSSQQDLGPGEHVDVSVLP